MTLIRKKNNKKTLKIERHLTNTSTVCVVGVAMKGIAQNTTSCERKDLRQVFTFFYKLCIVYCVFPISVCTISRSADASAVTTSARLSANIRVEEVENLARTNLFASEHKLISCNYFMLMPGKHVNSSEDARSHERVLPFQTRQLLLLPVIVILRESVSKQ